MTTARTRALPDVRSSRLVSDRTLNRLIVSLIALLAIGVPVIGITYYLDRHVDNSPSMPQRAIDSAEQAVRDNPNLVSARIGLAGAYMLGDRPSDAITQYAIVLDSEPHNRTALLGRADAYRASGSLDAAAGDYQAVIAAVQGDEMAGIDKQLEAAYYGLGAIQLEQNNARDAAANLANALVINGTDADALDLMGQALIQLGDYEAATNALRNAVALVPTGWCDPYDHLAQAYGGKSDNDGAAYASAMGALCRGQLDEAQAALDPLVNGGHGRDALVGLALVAENRGDDAAAAGYYRQIYDRDPTDFAAITGLARVGGGQPSTVPATDAPESEGQ